MANQIQINDELEIAAAAELEAVKMISAKIAEQNATLQKSIKTLIDIQVAQGENLAAMFASMVDAIKDIQITVKVPEQPAPTVNVEQAKAARKSTATVRKDKDGNIIGFDLTEG